MSESNTAPRLRTVAPQSLCGCTIPPALCLSDLRALLAEDEARWQEDADESDRETPLRVAVQLYAIVYHPQAFDLERRMRNAVEGIAASLRQAGVPVFVGQVHAEERAEPELRIVPLVTANVPTHRSRLLDSALESACARIAAQVVTNDPAGFDLEAQP